MGMWAPDVEVSVLFASHESDNHGDMLMDHLQRSLTYLCHPQTGIMRTLMSTWCSQMPEFKLRVQLW